MRSSHRLLAAVLTVALLFLPTLVRADDDKSAAAEKPADKIAEKAPPAEVTTQGIVNVAGEKIAYTAIAGTLTVGSTDIQDAQLGLDASLSPAASWPSTRLKTQKM